MAHLKLVLRTDKGSDGLHPVWLRVTHERKTSYVNTGVKVKSNEWNDKSQKVKRSNPGHASDNKELQRMMLKAQSIVYELRDKEILDANNVKKHLQGGDVNGDFFDYMLEHIRRVELKGQYWNSRNYRATMEKLISFNAEIKRRQRLRFKEITPKYLRDFELYLSDPQGDYGNNATTIAKNMSMIRTVFNSAISDGLIKQDDSPFGKGKYTIPRPKSSRTKLSYQDIKKIEALDLPEGSNIRIARDTFIFAFYCDGMRFGDLALLKWDRIVDDRLTYSMGKTGKLQSTRLPQQALDVLEAYRPAEPGKFVFPILNNDEDYSDIFYLKRRISARNALINRDLKRIQKLAGIAESISFHVSRHTFAHHLITKKVPTYVVSKKLQHSSLAITQNYLKVWDADFIDESMEGVFD